MLCTIFYAFLSRENGASCSENPKNHFIHIPMNDHAHFTIFWVKNGHGGSPPKIIINIYNHDKVEPRFAGPRFTVSPDLPGISSFSHINGFTLDLG